MKKKIIISATISFLIVISIIILSKARENFVLKPDSIQIQNICELATIKTYYTNVVRHTQPAGKGFEHIGEVDRQIWIEYTGSADIGVNMSKVFLEVKRNKVIVYMPKAEIQNLNIEKLSKDSYKMTKDSWFNKNKISAKKQNELINEGQQKMKKTIEEDENIMNAAQERAKELIKNHIERMGKLSRKEYDIEWVIR